MSRKSKVFRPYLDDVERLSHGKGAKKQRGTGSRMVCHRLNRDERKLYELAKQASFLTMRGTGYRKNRKGSPLCNIFRQRCDASEEICVIIEKRADLDTVVIDFSTLRARNDNSLVASVLENVFRAKYPDLYKLVMKDHADEDGNASSVIRTPINWEAVKTKAIWGVDERLIKVSCERDVAKSLAVDVLKESSNFTFLDDDDDDVADDEVIIDECAQSGGGDEVLIASNTSSSADNVDDTDDNSIDWNDI